VSFTGLSSPFGLASASPERIARISEDIRKELAFWEAALTGDWFAGPLSAVDFTLYPELALVSRNPGLISDEAGGRATEAIGTARCGTLRSVTPSWYCLVSSLPSRVSQSE
jgi:hypothetical protein